MAQAHPDQHAADGMTTIELTDDEAAAVRVALITLIHDQDQMSDRWRPAAQDVFARLAEAMR